MALEFWCSQELMHILDGNTLKPLSSDPFLVSNAKLILQKIGLTLKLYHFDANGSIRLSVADSDGHNRLRILVDPNKFIINNRIRVTSDGNMTVRNIENNFARAELHMICTNVDEFNIRDLKFGSFDFVVGRNNVDVVMMHPIQITVRSFVCFFLWQFLSLKRSISHFNAYFRSFQGKKMLKHHLNLQVMWTLVMMHPIQIDSQKKHITVSFEYNSFPHRNGRFRLLFIIIHPIVE